MAPAILVAVYLTLPGLFGRSVFASELGGRTTTQLADSGKTVWTLLAAALIFSMQVGFAMLETGVSRARTTANILLEALATTFFSALLFYAFGFALLFGPGSGFVGHHWFWLQGVPTTYPSTGVAFLGFWLFQFALANTCGTLACQGFCGRVGFLGKLLFSGIVASVIYPVAGHWIEGSDGFLRADFRDFSGSTAVNMLGGLLALAWAVFLRSREGRPSNQSGTLPPDPVITAAGCLLVWLAWYGFNPGVSLLAMDRVSVVRVAGNVTLAACGAAAAALLLRYLRTGRWNPGSLIFGLLGGLVSISCSCLWVTGWGSAVIGTAGGFLVVAGMELLERYGIRDPIGAVPIHGLCGLWGTISLGLFGAESARGLFYGGGARGLLVQGIGCAMISLPAFAVFLALVSQVRLMALLRRFRDGRSAISVGAPISVAGAVSNEATVL